MFELLDGRRSFYQWETNRKLRTAELPINSIVLFSNRFSKEAIPIAVKEFNGEKVCDVPNELLQQSEIMDVHSYVMDESGYITEYHREIAVKPQKKPPNYKGEETEILNGEPVILVDEEGNEVAGILTDEEVNLTATSNDIRLGTTAVTNDGLTDGKKVIPAYHTNQGIQVITAGSKFEISSLKLLNAYDFTKLQAIICDFNTSLTDSVSANKVVIDNNLYAVLSTETISELVKNDEDQTIDFGITNETDNLQILRFFTYKEIK